MHRACPTVIPYLLMSRLDTILNPQENIIPTPRSEVELTSSPPLNSSPTSSAGEPSRTSKFSHSLQDAKEHCAHPTCPDTLRCLPDTDGRPQHTLPVILRCAILGSKMKRLTIREIYAAMEDKYPYYRTAGSTWKQSVRHHLSLNRLFERQPRPVTDPGFGSYWTVNLQAPPGTKRPRKRGRPQREVNDDPESGPAKKRGRPRKVPETESRRQIEHSCLATLPVPSADHVSALLGVSTARTGSRHLHDDEDEDHVTRSELGASWRSINMHPTPSPSRGKLRQVQDDTLSEVMPENIIDHLKVQMGLLRRQTSEARSEAANMAQRLQQCQAEASRAKGALRAAEEMLELEVQRREDAERLAEEEARMRKLVEDELRILQ
ncbi:hypothetical protein BGY98DRAFT_952344 [Russula aff. rugulosa BPL654]|nr:hypothetical protein BGY98DRAFT_952344 [Russula aff. rugulosa BPL654]